MTFIVSIRLLVTKNEKKIVRKFKSRLFFNVNLNVRQRYSIFYIITRGLAFSGEIQTHLTPKNSNVLNWHRKKQNFEEKKAAEKNLTLFKKTP